MPVGCTDRDRLHGLERRHSFNSLTARCAWSIAEWAYADHPASELATVTLPTGQAVSFPIDGFSKACLLKGTDELGYLLGFEKQIAAYEALNG